MKKRLVSLGIIITMLSFSFAGCGGDKFADAKSVLNDMAKLMDNFAASLEKVENGKDAAKAISEYTASMKKMKPEMDALEKKYPEFKNKQNPPEELKAELKKIEESAQKMMPAFLKITKYQQDPDVAKALMDLQSLMN